MPVSDTYIIGEKLNPLSDEFYQRYGIFELSGEDNSTFSPVIVSDSSNGKKLSFDLSDGLEPIPPATPVEHPRKKFPIFCAAVVRLVLIGHNVMSVWRVTATYNDNMYWLMALGNVLMIGESLYTICKRGGEDYKWWCPCFLIYLATTLPAVWFLQLHEVGDNKDDSSDAVATTLSPSTDSAVTNSTTPTIPMISAMVNVTATAMVNLTTNIVNSSSTAAPVTVGASQITGDTESTITSSSELNNVTGGSNTTTKPALILPTAPDNEVWLIIVEEALIYLLVFCRWLLPRRSVSREFLADLLLEFLAIASDIMELLAVFDEPQVRGDRTLNYWVMGIWSASFIQFIPVLAHKRMFRRTRSAQMQCFKHACGTYFVEIIYTFMSVFLQDGPFLALRLYIMIRLRLITYSLVFFVLKNIVTLILLFYRLGIMCYNLPCCKSCKKSDETTVADLEEEEENAVADLEEEEENAHID